MGILHSRFSTDESQRYAAECKRLAGLSRTARATARRPASKPQQSDWLSQLWSPSRKLSTKLAVR
jgi:hypothetical protein